MPSTRGRSGSVIHFSMTFSLNSNRAMMDKAGNPGAQHGQPVLQCVQIKPLQGGGGGGQGGDRYRVVFSDTVNFIQSMLATRKLRSWLTENQVIAANFEYRVELYDRRWHS